MSMRRGRSQVLAAYSVLLNALRVLTDYWKIRNLQVSSDQASFGMVNMRKNKPIFLYAGASISDHEWRALDKTQKILGEVRRPAMILGLSHSLALMSFNFDSILLGFMRGSESVGWYNAGYKPVLMALALPVTYFIGLYPTLSRTYEQRRHDFGGMLADSLRLMSVIALPLRVVGIFTAGPIFLALCGQVVRTGDTGPSIAYWIHPFHSIARYLSPDFERGRPTDDRFVLRPCCLHIEHYAKPCPYSSVWHHGCGGTDLGVGMVHMRVDLCFWHRLFNQSLVNNGSGIGRDSTDEWFVRS